MKKRGHEYLVNKYKVKTNEQDKLITDNIGLVYTITNKYLNSFGRTKLLSHYDIEDLIHDGIIDLIKATRSYNPEKGKLGSLLDLYIKRSLCLKLDLIARKFNPLISTETKIGTSDKADGVTVIELVKDTSSSDQQCIIDFKMDIKSITKTIVINKNNKLNHDDYYNMVVDYYLNDITMQDIGDRYNMTRAYVYSKINAIMKIYKEVV